MNTLALCEFVWFCSSPQKGSLFHSMYNMVRHAAFSSLSDMKLQYSCIRISQCISEDDVMNSRRILRRWLTGNRLDHGDFRIADIERIPFGSRYFYMGRTKRHPLVTPSNDKVASALCPQTDFDRRESALWFNGLLHCLHRKVHQTLLERGFHDLYVNCSADILSWCWTLLSSPGRMDFLGR